ncbi:hypothetical protein IJD44_00650 [bacterium]|nr:hypothetical protein [bacterium]
MFRKLGVEVDGLSGTKKMDLFPPDTVTKINKISSAMKIYSSTIEKSSKSIDKNRKDLIKQNAELATIED